MWAVIYVPAASRAPRRHRARCAVHCRRAGWGVAGTTTDPEHALRLVDEGTVGRVVVARDAHLRPLVPPAVVAGGTGSASSALVVAGGLSLWWWVRRGGVAVAAAGSLAMVPALVYDPVPPPVGGLGVAPSTQPAPAPVPRGPAPSAMPPTAGPTPRPSSTPSPTPSPTPTPEPSPSPTPSPCVEVELIIGVELCLPGFRDHEGS